MKTFLITLSFSLSYAGRIDPYHRDVAKTDAPILWPFWFLR